jgi:hypothetical protein
MSVTLLTLFSAFCAVYITTKERINNENELKLSNAVIMAKSYSNVATDTEAIVTAVTGKLKPANRGK